MNVILCCRKHNKSRRPERASVFGYSNGVNEVKFKGNNRPAMWCMRYGVVMATLLHGHCLDNLETSVS